MTPQQIVGLTVRLFSIWLVVIAVQMFAIASAMNEQFRNVGAQALYALPALPLMLAAALWFFPMFVAHKLVPRSHDLNTLKMPAREAAAAAAAIIGIWVIIAALPQIVAAVSLFFFARKDPDFGMYFSPDRIFSLLVVAVQFALGFALVSKPWFVANKVFPSSPIDDRPAQELYE